MNLRFASIVDWNEKEFPGKIASVVYLAGCPLRCPWCYSGALVTAPNECSIEKSVDFFLNHLLKQREKTNAVVFTGGEPTEQGNALAELCERLRAAGFAVKIETSGFYPEALADLLPNADVVALDLKTRLAQDDYAAACGFNGSKEVLLSNVLRSLAFLETRGKNFGVEWQARTTIVPGLNDDAQIIREIARTGRNADSFVLQAFEPNVGELVDAQFASRGEPSRDKMLELAAAAKEELGDNASVLIRIKSVEIKI
ncbi:MAG: radical SAM protein [Candidatus Norongarragalinales archaeon]